jgi:hypothetical protein
MDALSTAPIDPEIEAAVLRFMKANPQQTLYYWRMLRQDPERALRELMCRRMSRMEELEKLADVLIPLVRQWAEQVPGLHERIKGAINRTILFPSLAYIDAALRMNVRMDLESHSKAAATAPA